VYDFLFVIIEFFFAISYCWDVTGGNLSTWAIFEGRSVLWISHKTRVWQTDKRTDRQNYDFQDRASVAASRCKKQNLTSLKQTEIESRLLVNVNIKSYAAYRLPWSSVLSKHRKGQLFTPKSAAVAHVTRNGYTSLINYWWLSPLIYDDKYAANIHRFSCVPKANKRR